MIAGRRGHRDIMVFGLTIIRRALVASLIGTVVAVCSPGGVRAEEEDVLSRDSVLRDAEIPALGNPDGDITIVEYFDYQCPYCKKVAPELAQVVKEDGKVRLVMKDWPILGPPSDLAARLVPVSYTHLDVYKRQVLRDAEIPALGNPDGDITIVEYFDYQCPYCKKVAPELAQVVKEDGKVRLVMKDWPILGPPSDLAARLVPVSYTHLDVYKRQVLRDAEIPALGNPDGDITIVEYFDYQCPYCKKVAPELAQVVKEDGKVRLVMKDWPILGPPSDLAARLVPVSYTHLDVYKRQVLRDAEIPALGNPDGDITIVEYFDYQCPYCKKVAPELAQVVKEDGKVRLVMKDWPILGPPSDLAARLVPVSYTHLDVYKRQVLRDAEIPALGNPDGDITIVEYFDYQCPYCKKVAPELAQVVKEDGKVRLVMKDWPILGPPSDLAARLVPVSYTHLDVYKRQVLRDAEIPALGNPDGDITIVEYFDYQCPYCKKVAPELAQVVKEDGKVRLVMKDWPILGPPSDLAARLVPVSYTHLDVYKRQVLRDAEIPALGNPDGDITIVEYFDYQCPYCKKVAPELAQVVKEDGKVRLVMKDWPILGPPSDLAARLVPVSYTHLDVYKRQVLRDAEIPALGNPDGDITIVEYFDYQCPYCKKVAPELAQVVKEDGKVRLVMKDWPILGPPSDLAARLVPVSYTHLDVYKRQVLRDAEIPALGNPDGDITIVEYFDYQCPYCKKVAPELAQVVKEDGKVRLVMKDWPILGPPSDLAARLVPVSYTHLDVYKRQVLRDAEIPALGNPDGDITIVEYFDYQCPYCKKVAPELAQVVKEDGKVRLVMKDWPILGPPSDLAARLVPVSYTHLDVYKRQVLRDAEIPALGNPDGDITIVEYFDYQCPYCKKVAPELAQVVKEDGKVRLVMKDWPILGPPSDLAARLVPVSYTHLDVYKRQVLRDAEIPALGNPDGDITIVEYFDYQCPYCKKVAPELAQVVKEDGKVRLVMKDWPILGPPSDLAARLVPVSYTHLDVYKRQVLRDAEIPALGNPDGDITIVEYFDYQCPYCKKVAPELAQVVKEDGKVRLVMKDWPILGPPSDLAARLVPVSYTHLDVYKRQVLRDAEIPALGNPDGDITIVEYFDYQCPYCKKVAPELAQVVKEDGKVRLVMKDWPILGPPSDLAARLVPVSYTHLDVYKRQVLRDAEIPALGNPDGDITIVEYFDYQCPYCKKVAPELAQVVKEDGKVRLVMKDWPILGPPSDLAARLVPVSYTHLDVYKRQVLRDAEIPALGNPDGDITIVEYFDYQCPYCKKVAPELAQVVKEDGKVRLVMKDWPILGPPSDLAARLVPVSYTHLDVYKRQVLRDAEIPALGNPDGDITIVEYFDYQCPYCKKVAPELAQVVKEDGKVRLVMKDWPILGPPSDLAARLVPVSYTHLDVYKRQVLRDAEIPALGNPDGDITIVEYFDYQCPYCKKVAPELAQVVKEDGKVRLVMKDWPILGPPSDLAARLVPVSYTHLDVYKRQVLRDAEIPALGNPDGDITIVEYFDYQCPYCKKVAPELAQVVKEDGKVRLVMKDWPILGPPSDLAARLVPVSYTHLDVYKRQVLRDAEIPALGNPDGDITIVEYFDYQCPYCKKVAPELAQVVKEDGKVRLVMKDWPILGPPSDLAARLVPVSYTHLDVYKRQVLRDAEIPALGNPDGDITIVEYFDYQCPYCKKVAPELAQVVKEDGKVRLVMKDWPILGPPSDLAARLVPVSYTHLDVYKRQVLRDAEIPALGNPDGDITIVEYFDYQCPYCKKVAPELAQVVKEDGKVRLVMKDWPILGPPSDLAARLVPVSYTHLDVYKRQVLRDAEIPALGNPDGDITIVEYFDYQCPYCKKVAPELAQVVKEDGKVRLVMKDWPILGPPSDLAARLVPVSYTHLDVYKRQVLRDAEIPALGNPDGDITIVEYFDYQCPYCKKVAPELAQVVKEDGKVRLVMKDWPILGPPSDLAARLVPVSYTHLDVYKRQVLRDAEIPALGNPDGDITIVEYFDYQCPYCKKVAPELAQVVKEDGKVRLVMKDWPILGPPSDLAARLVPVSYTHLDVYKRQVLRDAEIPALGNPDGDITIVEYFDYQCPYCKKVAPELAQVVKEDGKVRLVMKDWPILGPPSDLAARLVPVSYTHLDVYKRQVLRDAEIPALGNPDGDITIVEYFDYQCPYCKKVAPELAQVVKEDGKVRLVMKDWPILGPPSDLAARLVPVSYTHLDVYKRQVLRDAEIPALGNPDGDITIVEYFDYQCPYCKKVAPELAQVVKEDGKVRLVMKDWPILGPPSDLAARLVPVSYTHLDVYKRQVLRDAEIPALGNPDGDITIVEYFDYQCPYCKKVAPELAQVVKEDGKVRLVMKDWPILGPPSDLAARLVPVSYTHLDVYKRQVLRDAEIPALGNPDGDITIVEYFDYQCPYCKKVAPELAQVVKEDGKVRLVMKDWPILGPPSDLAARLVPVSYTHLDVYKRQVLRDAEIPALGNPDGDITIVEYFDYQCPYCKKVAPELAQVVKEDGKVRLVMKDWPILGPPSDLAARLVPVSYTHLDVYKRQVLRDAEIPALGNPDGDITIVEYFDYQCPYCKKVAPELAQVVKEDGKVRLVMKDWPILGPPSDLAARLVPVSYTHLDVYKRQVLRDAEIPALGNPDGDITIVEYFDYQCPYCKKVAPELAQVVKEDGKVRLVMKDWPILGPPSDLAARLVPVSYTHLDVYKRQVLRDAEIPALGNPDGDITIVEYFDYQCPYCKKVAPELAQVVKEDGKVRLVMKDWPILGPPSDLAARLVPVSYTHLDVYKRQVLRDAEIPALGNPDGDITIVEYFDYQCPYCKKVAPELAQVVKEDGKVRLVMKDWPILGPPSDLAARLVPVSYTHLDVYKRQVLRDAEIPALGNPDGDITIVEYFDYQCPYCKKVAPELAQVVKEDGKVRLVMKDWPILGPPSDLAARLVPVSYTHLDVYKRQVLRDAEIPALGNPDGDITIVEYFDYQCPYCKKVAPELAQVVKEDGKVRLVMKDWPILGPPSDLAARLVPVSYTHLDVYKRQVLRDAEIPALGNPDGDITIVEYFDYQCPYCKKVAPELAQVVKEDGKVRLVMKDWPILGPPSDLAARLVPVSYTHLDVYKRQVLRDAEIPALGNPDGDITIVEYFDYQCPYCKKVAPELAQVVKEDGKVRLVMKDWPILGPPSDLAARLVPVSYTHLDVYKRQVLRDAEIPALGNPDGDITIVEYFDYQCPYCKKVAPELAQVVKEDGKVRLVMKDWPILGPPSDLAARLVPVSYTHLDVYKRQVLRDAEIPALGNPDGDITIVEYFDYQCPYCKKVAPELAQVVKEDGKVRLVMKDWPILGPPSDLAARLVPVSYTHLDVYKRQVLRDAEIPALGNPDGDITIVEYFDYQCPYCKKVAPELAQVVKEDGKVRLVMKDWPILGPPSDLAARLVPVSYTHLDVYKRQVLRDAEIPALGNPDGDITIVEYFDYQCPYCKKVAPELAQVVKEDGKVRLVMKDWPILGPPSDLAARLVPVSYTHLDVYKRQVLRDAEIPALGNPDGDITIVEYFDYQCPYCKKVAPELAQVVKEDGKVRLVMKDWPILGPPSDLAARLVPVSYTHLDVYKRQVLRDAEIPALGNPDGDITIVEYFDYQCPYCKKVAPELAQVVKEDGKVRLVMKDWPILGPPSDLAARLVPVSYTHLDVYKRQVLRDAEIPALGNPDGDITIVEYFDYQCPYCKKVAPELAQVVKEDGKVRLVMKDWPILGPPSDLAARLVPVSYTHLDVYKRQVLRDAEIPALGNPDGDITIVEYFDYQCPYCKKVAPELAQVVKEDGKVRLVMKDWPILGPPSDLAARLVPVSYTHLDVYKRQVLRDAEIPALGNPDGDITIVEYFDYQCPYCKKVAPELAQVVKEDGKVRLVMKDWPILGPPSDLAARLVPVSYTHLDVYKRQVLRDAEIPALGNPDGDITIVEYFDYQCPYCKKVAPELAQVVKEDGKVRLVMKDWPILGPPSDLAARLVPVSYTHLDVYKRQVLRDAEIPALGNPDGDITIVEYFDYQCPYCKKVAPELAQVVKEDGKVRLVMKDWPILGPPSDLAARLVPVSYTHLDVYKRQVLRDAEIPALGNPDGDITIVEYFDYQCPYCKKVAPELAQVVKEDGKVRLVMKDWPILGPPSDLAARLVPVSYTHLDVYKRQVLRDAEIPALGNPDGDITIVEYFDYQCPYCKKVAPELAQVVKEDGKVRLVMKDWPILGPPSDLAARLVPVSYTHLDVYKRQVLRDAEIPALGNPDGDITIVEYFDYQCPYCKKVAPELAQVVKEDGKVRLVMKDWPILGPPSDLAARLVPVSYTHLDVYKRQVLRDAEIPALGNPDGDITIVEYFDYQCPYCKKVAPELAQVVKEDGKVRLVMKDWPILGPPSDLAARLVPVSYTHLDVYKRQVLRDAEIPALGNPDGDITIVEYFDYQCPYCKKVAPELAQVVKEDGKVRLVMKDWPILGPPSDLAARLVPVSYTHLDVYKRQVLRDAEIPALGNPDGDITIVEYFDYQCPYCKKVAPELAQVVKEDGKVRLVMKDWPILGPPSDLAARLVPVSYTHLDVYKRQVLRDAEIPALGNPDGDITIVEYFDYQCPYCKKVAPELAQVVKEDGKVRLVMKDWPILGPPSDLAARLVPVSYTHLDVYKRQVLRDAEIPALGNPDGDITIVEYFDYQCPYCKKVAPELAQVVKEDGKVRLVMKDWPILGPPSDLAARLVPVSYTHLDVYKRQVLRDAEIPALGNPDGDITIVEYFDYQCPYCKKVAPELAQVVKEDGKVRLVMKDWPILGPPSDLAARLVPVSYTHLDVYKRQVLRDAEIPALGNPDGDITIVEYFDYQCPYCKKVAPELAQVVKEDGKVRLVMKDWPILGPPSDLAARLVPVSYTHLDVYKRQVLRDAEIPALGNPDGDITIVEYFDYQCPYCKKVAPELAQVVKEDGKVRLVMKDWPILGPPSDLAARLVPVSYTHLDVYKRQVLRDAEIPALGNPDGDITIVEYFDYQCPYCKKVAPELAQVVKEDGKVRLVMKDWPILGPPSDLAARLVPVSYTHLDVYKRQVLRDAEIPALGNPDGDITIVEYFDYQCPYCKKVAPELAQVVKEDGKVRLVMKDWPILGPPSDLAARLVPVSYTHLDVYKRQVLRDAEIPALGNPDGDITIVEYFDYQCPYCKKVAPELAQVVKEDGKVRLVMKDWPILGPPSDLAARLVPVSYTHLDVYKRQVLRDAEIPALGNPDGDITIVEYFDYQCPYCKKVAPELAQVVKEDGKVRLVMKDWPILGPPSDLAARLVPVSYTHLDVYKRQVLRDAEIPALGNPDGDITIVEYFDYQCPYCKKVAPELAQVVKEDGKVRLVMKDWPILGPPSDLAARLVPVSYTHLDVYKRQVLRDAEIPALGNPDGDITIVEYFDYQCPYCKKVAPELAQVVKEDGKVRLVMKDWPILGPPSDLAARLVPVSYTHLDVYKRQVLRDAEIPALGNPDGDITIVEYFDYQCPYCKKVAPELAQVVKEDGKVRLVMKDWPILGPPSDLAARLVPVSYTHLDVYKRQVLRDAEIPALGNPDGDITIVEYFDYQCPYCKKVAPELAQVVKEDGKVRLVMKDWPILGPPSDLAARLVPVSYTHLDVYKRQVLRDAEIPALGNPDGDITIVEYFDYQCPYCKKVAPELAQVVKEDGKVRLVMKDWPILGPPSDLAARLVPVSYTHLDVYKRQVLRDAEIPALGNPDGDITIVEYFDYQCPYCKKVAPELAQVVKEDGKVRLVMKDWPILGPPSDLAARLVLATRYQNKYQASHDALIGLKGRLTETSLRETLTQAGVDVAKADADLVAHKTEIEAVLKRNNTQAEAFGFRGTPAFIVGTFRIPGVLDAAMFKRAIADARAAAKPPKK